MIAYPSQMAKANWNLCGTTRAPPWDNRPAPRPSPCKGKRTSGRTRPVYSGTDGAALVGSGRQDDLRILGVRPVEDEGPADHLNQVGALQALGQGSPDLAGGLRSRLQRFHLEQLAGGQRLPDHALERLGQAPLADAQVRLERVGQRAQVGQLLRRQGADNRLRVWPRWPGAPRTTQRGGRLRRSSILTDPAPAVSFHSTQ